MAPTEQPLQSMDGHRVVDQGFGAVDERQHPLPEPGGADSEPLADRLFLLTLVPPMRLREIEHRPLDVGQVLAHEGTLDGGSDTSESATASPGGRRDADTRTRPTPAMMHTTANVRRSPSLLSHSLATSRPANG